MPTNLEGKRLVRAHNGIEFWVSEANYESLIRDGQVTDVREELESEETPAPKPARKPATRKRSTTTK